MLDNNTIVRVTNRSNGVVVYQIPDLGNLVRRFMKGETKEVTFEELKKLSYVPGGQTLLVENLIVDNKEAIAELLGAVEPEYNYTEAQIKELLLRGSLDAFLDCLDFAPEGVLDLIKDLAVTLKINDIAKRDAIKKKLHFDVTKAIEINEESEKVEEEAKTRRVAIPGETAQTAEPAKPARRIIIAQE